MREITDEIKTYIREKFHYNPITGDLWSKYNNSCKIIGYKHHTGYQVVDILSKQYAVHRIVWFLSFGEFPKNQIDHIDRNRYNNKIENLREATYETNSFNKSICKINTSGFKGVWFHKRVNKWNSCIGFNNKRIHIGYYNTPEEASAAYQKKAAELFGAFNPIKE